MTQTQEHDSEESAAARPGTRRLRWERRTRWRRPTLAGRPIHPILVPFPLAALGAAFFTDLQFLRTADPFWARGSLWLVGSGLAVGAMAGIFGLLDYLSIRRARASLSGFLHPVASVAVLILAFWNFVIRAPAYADRIRPWGILLSGITLLALGVAVWHGLTLVYRHRIGLERSQDG